MFRLCFRHIIRNVYDHCQVYCSFKLPLTMRRVTLECNEKWYDEVWLNIMNSPSALKFRNQVLLFFFLLSIKMELFHEISEEKSPVLCAIPTRKNIFHISLFIMQNKTANTNRMEVPIRFWKKE